MAMPFEQVPLMMEDLLAESRARLRPAGGPQNGIPAAPRGTKTSGCFGGAVSSPRLARPV